ncbi:VWA domain-containing protein [Amycolatopsis sp. NBC_00348]|uniref:vWA domain-containing protein n=1 Tax=Amycolatopsis sp. NBC_00348 TaxID=2975956 RepID=UPI002E27410A
MVAATASRPRRAAVICAVVLFSLFGQLPFATAQTIEANPPWPAHCPLRIGLLIDQSSSMEPRFDEVREAASNVVDALRDKHSEVSIIDFGTDARVVRSAVDISDDDSRHQLKEQIGDLSAHDGDNDGATNWEAAFLAAKELRLNVAVLITDGLPNVYGNPVQEGDEAVPAAIAASTQLKRDHTRVAGVGIDLDQVGARNLASVTGPNVGQDYFVTDTSGLLRQLYGIVASSCGVTIAALPQPEPPVFPWGKVLLGTLGGLVLLALVAYALHRRRGTSVRPAPATAGGGSAKGGRIDHSDLTKRVRGIRPDEQNTNLHKDQP